MHFNKALSVCVILAAFVALVFSQDIQSEENTNDEPNPLQEWVLKEWARNRLSEKREPLAVCEQGSTNAYCFGWKREDEKRDPEQWRKRRMKLKGLNMNDAWKRSVRRRSVSSEE